MDIKVLGVFMRKIFIFVFILSIQNVCCLNVFRAHSPFNKQSWNADKRCSVCEIEHSFKDVNCFSKSTEIFNRDFRSISAGPTLSNEEPSRLLEERVEFCQSERKNSPFEIKLFTKGGKKLEHRLSKGESIAYDFCENPFQEGASQNASSQFGVSRRGTEKIAFIDNNTTGQILFDSCNIDYELEYFSPDRGRFSVQVK